MKMFKQTQKSLMTQIQHIIKIYDTHHIIVIPGLTMCYSEVKVYPCDEHVRLQSDLMDRWWR